MLWMSILFKEYVSKELYARFQNKIACFAIVLQQT